MANGLKGWQNAIKELSEYSPIQDKDEHIKDEIILSLHRQLAAETLRANMGWERAEAKTKECIELRERMAEGGIAELLDALQAIAQSRGGCLCGHGEWCSNCDPYSPVIKIRKIAREAIAKALGE